MTPGNASSESQQRVKSSISPQNILLLSPDELVPMKNQPRTSFNQDAIIQLSNSMRTYGIIQPLVISPGSDQKYIIIAGERRWRAAILAGIKKIPCVMRTNHDHSELEVALIENIQREELSPVEEAKAYERLLLEHNYTQETLSSKIGKERSTISNSLRLLTLPIEILDELEKRTISAGHARALCGIDEKRTQIKYLKLIQIKKLSVRQTEEMIKKFKKDQSEPKKFKDHLPHDVRQLCDQFKGHLGTKVRISGNSDKGKIEISYYTFEDLERIAELVLGYGLDSEIKGKSP